MCCKHARREQTMQLAQQETSYKLTDLTGTLYCLFCVANKSFNTESHLPTNLLTGHYLHITVKTRPLLTLQILCKEVPWFQRQYNMSYKASLRALRARVRL